MKKTFLFLLPIIALVMFACGSDKKDEPKSNNVIANVTYDGTSASPSMVNLYNYDAAKNFDKTAIVKFGDTQTLVDNNGNVIKPAYVSPTTIGVNTFEDVKPGKYIAIALYKPNGYSFPNFYYYGYATVDATSGLTSVTFKFTSQSPRGEFIQF